MKPIIGILAGMGPRTTAPFLEKVLDYCRTKTGAIYDDEFPEIVVVSLPNPFRPNRPYKVSNMLAALKRGLGRLEASGASFIAIPCNVAHLYMSEMKEMTRVPLLNIVEVAVKKLDPQLKRVGVLSTRPVGESRLFQLELEKAGFQSVELGDIQKSSDDLILKVKSQGYVTEVKVAWSNLYETLRTRGVQQVLIACTDFSPLATTSVDGLPFVCTMDAVAEEVITHWNR